VDRTKTAHQLHGFTDVPVLWAYCGLDQLAPEETKSFGIMVARDGIEPPTPAFSGSGRWTLCTTRWRAAA
jgi:hypothetical protein